MRGPGDGARAPRPFIGPRTIEQLDGQITAADVTLDAAMLDRIDQIVRPGVNLNPADTSYGEHVLKPALRRRWPARADL